MESQSSRRVTRPLGTFLHRARKHTVIPNLHQHGNANVVDNPQKAVLGEDGVPEYQNIPKREFSSEKKSQPSTMKGRERKGGWRLGARNTAARNCSITHTFRTIEARSPTSPDARAVHCRPFEGSGICYDNGRRRVSTWPPCVGQGTVSDTERARARGRRDQPLPGYRIVQKVLCRLSRVSSGITDLGQYSHFCRRILFRRRFLSTHLRSPSIEDLLIEFVPRLCRIH
jgi:hypothetical protein